MVAPGPAAFSEKWVRESLQIQTGDLQPSRGLFWHPATDADDGVWAHYGFTGTAAWIAPDRRTWALLLTNKIYYSRDREPIRQLRDSVRSAAF